MPRKTDSSVNLNSMDLYEDTQGLVRTCSAPLTVIARDAEVSIRWLHRYLNNDYEDVGVRRVQRLRKVVDKLNSAK